MKQHPLCTDCEQSAERNGSAHSRSGLKREWAALETRRRFLGRSGKVLGWAALASLLRRSRVCAAMRRRRRTQARHAGIARAVEAAAFRSQGETRHLSVHVGRAAADRSARLQAEPCRALQQGHARLRARQPAVDGHDRGAGAVSRSRPRIGPSSSMARQEHG